LASFWARIFSLSTQADDWHFYPFCLRIPK